MSIGCRSRRCRAIACALLAASSLAPRQASADESASAPTTTTAPITTTTTTTSPGTAAAIADRFDAGDSAYTVARLDLRLSVLGRSAFGLTDRLELSTYLPLDAVLFPNLSLKYRFLDSGTIASAFELGVGGGLYPIPGAALLPLPGAFLGVAGLALIALGEQSFTLHLSFQPLDWLAVSLRGGLFELEAAVAVIGIAGGAGAGGGLFLPGGFAIGGAHDGMAGGAEIDARLGPRDVVTAEGDAWGIEGWSGEMTLAQLAWVHAWPRVHLELGAYALFTLPRSPSEKTPIGPFANVYWTFHL